MSTATAKLANARKTADHLRRVLSSVDAGELTATPIERAHLVGALAAFASLDGDPLAMLDGLDSPNLRT